MTADRESTPEVRKRFTFVVGDIHGCYDELSDLLSKADFTANDRVVAVGDLITKGPKNRAVLDRFIADERFTSVIGNHDLALLRFWRGEPVQLTRAQTDAFDQLENSRKQYEAYLASLPFLIDFGKYVVVHAGVRPHIPLARQSSSDLTELRTLGRDRASREGVPWYEVYDGEQSVLFGHWPASQPRVAPRAIGLDTGCVYGNRLTAFIIETGEFISVPARAAYCAVAARPQSWR